jgi:hypothetical protein
MLRYMIRNGRDIDQNIYMQKGDEPKGGPGGDLVIGHICHDETARDIVAAVNRDTARRTADPVIEGKNGADLRGMVIELREEAENTPEEYRTHSLLTRVADALEKLSWHIDADGRVI